MCIKQLDIQTAFLNGELEEKIYVIPPEGACPKGHIWLLKKAVYGLKQASKAWYKTLESHLKTIGFTKSLIDGALYLSKIAFIEVHVVQLI